MYFNVSQLLREPPGSSRAYTEDDTFQLLEGTPPSQVRGEVRLVRTDQGVWVNSSLDSIVVCTCSRCLSPYRQPIQMTIDEEFYSSVGVNSGSGALASVGSDDCLTIDRHNILDLTETIRQCAIVNLPLKPLCKEECAGICPNCGVSLNEGACQCVYPSEDPRWNPLRMVNPLADRF